MTLKREQTIWYWHLEPEDWSPECPEISMYERIKQTAERCSKQYALDFEGKKETYREMMLHIDEVSQALVAIGVQRGDVVSIVLPNMPQAVYLFYALNRIGAIANMVHPALSPNEIRHIVDASSSVAVFTLDVIYEKLAPLSWEEKPDVVLVRIIDALPAYKKLPYGLRSPSPKISCGTDCLRWKTFLRRGKGATVPDVACTGDDTAVIMYSGGTSGKPKGVMLTNLNFNVLALQSYETMGIHDVRGLKVLALLPIFHGTGLGVCIHSMLYLGIQVFLMPSFELKKSIRRIFQEKIELIFGVPALYEALARSREIEKFDCSFFRTLGSCGDQLPETLRKRVNSYMRKSGSPATMANGYGMTECTAGCCYEPRWEKKPGSSGRMVPDMECKIVQPGTQTELPTNHIGELCICGPTVMKGYYHDTEATARVLQRHSDGKLWLHSGDAFSIDEDGYLYFHHRLTRMFVVAGYNIYPSQIEAVVSKVSGVVKCCAVGKPDRALGCRVEVFVIREEGCSEDACRREILSMCAQNLAQYAQPSRITFLTEFPMTKMGKLDYQRLSQEETGEGMQRMDRGKV